jgi:hypothetical protein
MLAKTSTVIVTIRRGTASFLEGGLHPLLIVFERGIARAGDEPTPQFRSKDWAYLLNGEATQGEFERMRSLTEAEARVIRVLLADLPGPERERIIAAGVPRTTYQTIRLRAFINGWLEERYVPDPRMFAAERIRFVVAQPYAERWNESVRVFRALDGLVVLWASPETLFGVIFERSSSRDWSHLPGSDVFRRSWTVAPIVEGAGVVVYFDFEGAWSRWTLDGATVAYPRAFPHAASAFSLSNANRKAVWELSHRPFSSTVSERSPSLFSSSRLSHRSRRLLSEGWFSHRTLPNLGEIPPVHGYRPDRMVFVTGMIRSGGDPRNLFAALTARGRVAPIIFAYDAERALFLTLAPAPPHVSRDRGPLVELIQDDLEKVEVVREPIDSLFTMVDHRYDRLTLPPENLRRDAGSSVPP